MTAIAMLVGEDFEDSEVRIPLEELRRAGHDVTVIGSKGGTTISGKRGKEKLQVEATGAESDPDDYDFLVIPGGYGPDHLRTEPGTVEFVRKFVESGKPVAAICHGPQLLIEADVVRGKRLTSWPSVRTDLINAGATWVDEELVVDGQLITSRKPDDLKAFTRAILERV